MSVMKYIKPKSLTFWTGGVAPISASFVIALSGAIPELLPAAVVIDALTGGIEPSLLFAAGLTVIGIRAAPGMG